MIFDNNRKRITIIIFLIVDFVNAVRKEDDFAVNSHIYSFFKAKILSDNFTFSTFPVVDTWTVREIFTDIDFTVWICDFVDNLAITMHIDTSTKLALSEFPTE